MVAGDITTGGALDTQVGRRYRPGQHGRSFQYQRAQQDQGSAGNRHQDSRLGIPLLVGMDVIHGYETMFPIPLALSCSWDTEAMKKVGEVSAKEASADGINWTFSPMVDIALDARCGRNEAKEMARAILSERRDGSSDDPGLPGRGYAHRRDSESQPHHGLSEAFCPVRRR